MDPTMNIDLDQALFSLKLALMCYVLTCFMLYLLAYLKAINCDKRVHYGGNTLVITAHPDDECMFFSPTLIQLSGISQVHILCLTTGNYYGQGAVREKEILNSCEILGIPTENVKILDNNSFADDPNVSWDLTKLREEVLPVIERIQPDYIFTFDEQGVSGHPNHIAVSKITKQIVLSATYTQKLCRVYQLESVSLIRKYISLFDLPMSLYSGHLMFISTIPEIIKGQFAMYAHYSQFVWFRILYIIFSRYMVINTFMEVL